MSQVDFYILPDSTPISRLQFACRLIEKIFTLGHKIYVSMDQTDEINQIDKLLWTFRETSFIPHGFSNTKYLELTPVIIGPANTSIQREVLINFCIQAPDSCNNFKRIVEVLNDQPHIKESGRQRYKQYCQMNHEVITHHA
ncbi:MAG: DNA polymerase III subunit chi [Methylococcales bacterium]|nr:DNA polymerase III subunit chi [Methylococcales bacterium]MBT7409576.1 DNA polymerase III subunit chi [Methylococcales bacterium]